MSQFGLNDPPLFSQINCAIKKPDKLLVKEKLMDNFTKRIVTKLVALTLLLLASASTIANGLSIDFNGKSLNFTEGESGQLQFFYRQYLLTPEQFETDIENIAFTLGNTAIRKGKQKIIGPLMFRYANLSKVDPENIKVDIGFPVKGQRKRIPRHKIEMLKPFKYLSLTFSAGELKAEEGWEALYLMAKKRNNNILSEGRSLVHPEGDSYRLELRLGIE